LSKNVQLPNSLSIVFEGSFIIRKMFRRSQQVILLLFTIITVSVTVGMGLLQEQTFERVRFIDGKLIKFSLARSIRTCVDSAL